MLAKNYHNPMPAKQSRELVKAVKIQVMKCVPAVQSVTGFIPIWAWNEAKVVDYELVHKDCYALPIEGETGSLRAIVAAIRREKPISTFSVKTADGTVITKPIRALSELELTKALCDFSQVILAEESPKKWIQFLPAGKFIFLKMDQLAPGKNLSLPPLKVLINRYIGRVHRTGEPDWNIDHQLLIGYRLTKEEINGLFMWARKLRKLDEAKLDRKPALRALQALRKKVCAEIALVGKRQRPVKSQKDMPVFPAISTAIPLSAVNPVEGNIAELKMKRDHEIISLVNTLADAERAWKHHRSDKNQKTADDAEQALNEVYGLPWSLIDQLLKIRIDSLTWTTCPDTVPERVRALPYVMPGQKVSVAKPAVDTADPDTATIDRAPIIEDFECDEAMATAADAWANAALGLNEDGEPLQKEE